VLLGALSDKTRVLVTHAIDFLHLADKIIIMEKGRIAAQGTFSELESNEHLKQLLSVNNLNTDTVTKASQEATQPGNEN